MRVLTQRGVIITGSRSTRARSISNDALPEPITIEARNSIVGTPDSRRIAADLLPRGEMLGEVALAEPAEVDDPAHTRRPRRAPERRRRLPIVRRERAA